MIEEEPNAKMNKQSRHQSNQSSHYVWSVDVDDEAVLTRRYLRTASADEPAVNDVVIWVRLDGVRWL